MALSGNLTTVLFGDLLRWLALGLRTGTLVVRQAPFEKRIYFRNGKVIASATNNPRQYLSEFLISSGHLVSDQIGRALDAQDQSKVLLGKILVMIDSIPEKELVTLMQMKAEEELYDLFLWEDADFEFVDDQLPERALIPLQIDPTTIATEGARRLDEWTRARQLIPSFDLVPTLERPVDRGVILEMDALIVQLVDGQRSIREILEAAKSAPFHIVVTLAELVRAGIVRLDGADPSPVEPSAVGPENEIASMVARAQISLRDSDFEEALRLLKAAQILDPANTTVSSALRGAEMVITADLRKEGISLARVPKIRIPIGEITSMDFSPNEGFLLSRINGIWDVSSIVKISPMREAEALMILQRLRRDGIIEFD